MRSAVVVAPDCLSLRGFHDRRTRPLPRWCGDPVHAWHLRHFSQPQERHRHPDVDLAHSFGREYQSHRILDPIAWRSGGAGIRLVRGHRRGGGGRHRSCYSRGLLPQSRLDCCRRNKCDEGLNSAMYKEIFSLPLLGAILAAIIALAGAHARHPGGPPHGAEEHTPTPEHPHNRPSARGGAATLHASHAEEQDEPAAAGSRSAELITTTLLFISMVLSWIAFVRVGFSHQEVHEAVLPFIVSGDLKVDWALQIDALTAVMLVVVTTVSAFVHLYSIGYMEEDPYRPRFFRHLSMFPFARLMLGTPDNLVQLVFGLGGVRLAGYLLIGFWYHKPEANAAAIKAFIVNRIGDFGFALGIFAVFMMTGAIDLDTVFAQAPSLTGKTMHFLSWDLDALTVICLLLFMGAMGKSAQFLLHTWLPDAMEGPTPVSALIHAATMVTAGAFLVARLSPLSQLPPDAQTVPPAAR